MPGMEITARSDVDRILDIIARIVETAGRVIGQDRFINYFLSLRKLNNIRQMNQRFTVCLVK